MEKQAFAACFQGERFLLYYFRTFVYFSLDKEHNHEKQKFLDSPQNLGQKKERL